MKSFIVVGILMGCIGAGIYLASQFSEESGRPKLKVYTYASFLSSWGPGRELETLFEQKCDCDLQFVESSDAGLLLQRLELETGNKTIDVVLGFDQLDIARAQGITKWRTLDRPVDLNPQLISFFQDTPFLPLDWGPLSFVYRKSGVKEFPTELEDLLSEAFYNQIVLEDPRISSPGFQFLIWVVHLKGVQGAKDFLRRFLPQTYKVAPSWSQAYGLFQEGHAPMVWSYVTSPVVHRSEENSEDYQALKLREPLPVQVELMGVPESCNQCELAEDFVRFLHRPESQKIIMEKNYMLPVINSVEVGTAFEGLGNVELAPINYRDMMERREELLKLWTDLRRGGG